MDCSSFLTHQCLVVFYKASVMHGNDSLVTCQLCNEICGACRHRPWFHRHAKQTTPGTGESIDDKKDRPRHKVTIETKRCNVCPSHVELEALWGPTKVDNFLFVSKALDSETIPTIPTICHKSVNLWCLVQHAKNENSFVLFSMIEQPQPHSMDLMGDTDQLQVSRSCCWTCGGERQRVSLKLNHECSILLVLSSNSGKLHAWQILNQLQQSFWLH